MKECRVHRIDFDLPIAQKPINALDAVLR